MTWKCRTYDSLATEDLELQLVNAGNGMQGFQIIQNFTIYNGLPGDQLRGVNVTREMLQAIMDGLWHDGYRPTGVTDVRESTAAIKDHLKDMRAIAAKKIGVVLP